MKINDKVKIKPYTNLFLYKSEAIAYELTKNIDYKPYNYFDIFDLLVCGKKCSKNCDGHDDEFINVKYKIFEILRIYKLDKVILIQINSRGNLLWTSVFEEIEL